MQSQTVMEIKLSGAFFLLLLSMALGLPSHAQENAEAITGQVLLNDHPPGDLAASINIALSQTDRPGEPKRGSVNADGEYRILNIKSGHYFITATASGFKPVRIEIEVINGNRIRGNTRIVLMPEHDPKQESSRGDIVSQNELRAPRKAVKHVELAEIALERGELEKVEGALDMALKEYPRYARAYFLKGRLEERRGQAVEAKTFYRRALEEDSDYFPAHAALAELLRQEENHTELRKVSDQWKKAQPLDSAPYYYSALASFQNGEFHAALEEALAASRFPHQNLPHLDLLLANCYVKLRQPEAAASHMEEFLKAYPKDPMAPQVQTTLTRIKEIVAQK